jgi:hypothetical protein
VDQGVVNSKLSWSCLPEDYKKTWEEAVMVSGLVLPAVHGVTTKAIKSMCNMKKLQMTQLCTCLKAELGLSLFSTEYKISQVLRLEHVEPTTVARISMGKRK